MSDWQRWAARFLLASAAVVTGAFASRTYDRKVRQIGRGFEAGQRTARAGAFACDGCGAATRLAAGDIVPACPSCGHAHFTKTG